MGQFSKVEVVSKFILVEIVLLVFFSKHFSLITVSYNISVLHLRKCAQKKVFCSHSILESQGSKKVHKVLSTSRKFQTRFSNR